MMRYRLRLSLARCLIAAGVIVGAGFAAPPSSAQDTPEDTGDDAGKYPDRLDGTLSAEGDLADDEAPKIGHLRMPTVLEPWFAFKEAVRESTGITFGGSYGVLWQNYQESLLGEDNSVGGKFALNFSRDMLFRGTPNALTFDMAVEARHPIGTEQAPLWAGFSAGSITATAATWGEFDIGITQAYIRQNLFDGAFQYTVGKIFAPNYVNAYPFFDDNRQFLNQNFSTSPTIPIPLRGFGWAAAFYPTDGGFYISGGMFTPYSSDTGWTIDDFFERNQYFYNVEIGWSSLANTGVPIQARGPMDANNFHITPWYRDELDDGTPEAYGVAFNANYLVADNVMAFLRGGASHGWVIDRNLAVGLGWRPNEHSDLFGIGLGWANPSNELLSDQFTAEVFYRYQVTPHFAITPDAQLILNPALNPNEDLLWALGIRSRLTF